MAFTTKHRLVTGFWTADVRLVEAAIRQFHQDSRPGHECQIVFFELAGDTHLHVNVTHQKPTTQVEGWDGPAITAAGYVHNRRFGERGPAQMIRHVRRMALAREIPLPTTGRS